MPDTALATHDFLVEIGTEELPPKLLRQLAADFHARLVKQLADSGLIEADAATEWFCSPRRLAVRIGAMKAAEPDREQERLGPGLAAAFGADGAPTAAAQGFARSCGVPVAALERRATDKGERLAWRQQIPGRPAATVLPEAVAGALAAMSIPRRMRWGAGDIEFVRPVHWLVMLLGDEVVRADILGATAGRATRGHRFHHPDFIELARPADYVTALEDIGAVQLDDAAGQLAGRIQTLAEASAREVGGRTDGLPALAAEVAALVERPVPVVAGFDPDFLTLPEEVIVAVLEGQQRYFPVRDSAGRLLPHFVAISNIDSRRPDEVRRGNERVVRPRLADAMFFWQTDRKTPLAGRAGELERIVFQAGLGSLADKADRIAALAPRVAPAPEVDGAALGRAAALCKCDLVTAMVGEFPELQGIMGGYYATAAGEPAAVAQAIREHYLPQKSGDAIPASPLGRRLAVADKLDSVAGGFALGRRPSGDKDPFALRRHAAGILRITLEAPLDINLPSLIGAALEAQPVPVAKAAAVGAEIFRFFMDRLRSHYQERGVRGDVVEAVLALDLPRPLDVDARIRALQAFVERPAALALAAANKRSANILRQASDELTAAPDPALLREAAEVALYEAIDTQRESVAALVAAGDYEGALEALATLREPVDRFFDEVLVMAEVVAERNNRLALLAALQALFAHTADWARIQVE